MKVLQFTFSTKLTFDDDVHDHSFALRCLPPECEGQHIRFCDLHLSPFVRTNQTVDAFGNPVVSGYLREEHRFLDFVVEGVAEVDAAKHRTDFMPCYRYASAYTKADDALRAFHAQAKAEGAGLDPLAWTAFLSKRLSEVMQYEKNVTTTETTAAQAFAGKKGVCQDFTHILLSLLRLDEIACRYIAGLACCDGETHSWLEVWNGTCWDGYDPTNLCETQDDYLMLSRGRDFGDCAIDRGVMFGSYTRQMQLVTSRITTGY